MTEIKLFPNCKLFILDKKIEEINKENVEVNFINGKPIYKLKENSSNEIIVQALNSKDASKKMLKILNSRRNEH
jgi:hypothetical protein